LFLLLRALAENVLVLGVRLREVVVAKALPELQLAAAFSIALDDQLDTPLDFGRRTLAPAAKILVVFDLELANIPLELTQFFVNRGHAWAQSSGPMLEVESAARQRYAQAKAADSARYFGVALHARHLSGRTVRR